MRLLVLTIFLFGISCRLATAAQITITPAACDQLVNYIEPPGVEYQPGIDANGDPVAPADLGNRPRIKPPTHIVVPITQYLAGRLTNTQAGATTQTGTAQTNTTASSVLQPQINIGTVEVTNGQVTFNGQPIGDDVDGDLGVLCRKIRSNIQ
jgi:hypothetical protein